MLKNLRPGERVAAPAATSCGSALERVDALNRWAFKLERDIVVVNGEPTTRVRLLATETDARGCCLI